jgi:hypothetical protein
MATHKLRFLESLRGNMPRGQVTSTARKGTKWYERVTTGDLLDLVVTETDKPFGRAVVIGAMVVPLSEVLDKPQANHSFVDAIVLRQNPADHLRKGLEKAYGKLSERDLFTVLHFLVVND